MNPFGESHASPRAAGTRTSWFDASGRQTSVATTLVSRVLFPLHERLKGHETIARLRELEASQWLPREAIEQARVEKLRRFLTTIAANVPYYARLFDAHRFEPRALRSVEDLARLPLLDKPTIRANVDALRSRSATGLKRSNTGGSSGEPLVFYTGAARRSHDIAAKWRATRWWGVDLGDREIVVWGSPVELSAQDWVRALRDRLMRTRLLPAFEMSEPNLDRFVSIIRESRPAMLFGYPSALAHIAKHAQRRGIRMDDLGIRVAFVTAERVYEDQRRSIADAFGCRVANGYGARDAGFIAHECPSGGMHISAEDVVVEIVDADGTPVPPGQKGEIVVTHTATGDFPFVRYRTGDVAALRTDACPCGRGLPCITEVDGRTTDFVIARDGTVLHALALIYTVRDLPGVEQFRIVQHDLDRIEVQLVASPSFSAREERRIVDDFKARLGADVRIEIVRVPAIAPERSGKYRYVVSHVQPVASGGNR